MQLRTEGQNKLLVPNSTQIPNVVLDKIIPGISEAEGRCLLYICRRTYGFRKERDQISLSQFMRGIVSHTTGERLDHGTGLSRPAIVEALRNLTKARLVNVIPNSKGNYYELNVELLGDKYVENGVVKRINQLRRLTRDSKESKPKQVKLFNPQYKGNKGNKDVIAKSNLNDERLRINQAGLDRYKNLKRAAPIKTIQIYG